MCVHSLEDLYREYPDTREEAEIVLPHVRKEFQEASIDREGECVILLLSYMSPVAAARFHRDIAHYWEGMTLRFAEMIENYAEDPEDLVGLTDWFLDQLDPATLLLLTTTRKIVGELNMANMVAESVELARRAHYAHLKSMTDGTIN